MKSSIWRQRLLESTRGRLLALLQIKNRTVNDLARELHLTDNAVRVHLLSLERDGLVRRAGTEPGVRRPHVTYGITQETESIFPKVYGALLNHLVTVLSKRLPARAVRGAMREVGRRVADANLPKFIGKSKKQRIDAALELLQEMGGAAIFLQSGGKHFIRGNGCPLAAVTATHPDACLIAETLLSTMIGIRVKQCCEHGPSPRCCFELGGEHR